MPTLMKSTVSHFVQSLFLLSSISMPALSGQSYGPGAYASQIDAYSDPPRYWTPYADPPSGFGGGESEYLPGDLPEWVPDPYGSAPYPGADPTFGVEPIPGGRYGAYPSPHGQAPSRMDQGWKPDIGSVPGDAYPQQFRMRGGLPPAAAPAYRFRGDRPTGFRAWGAPPQGYGYQYRPLTEQERQRRGDETRWRPWEQARSPDAPPHPDPLPAREAYGYESENWFNRYFGERR